jgi:thiamine-phosphate pyrophosphorylase
MGTEVDFRVYLITDRKLLTRSPEFPVQSARLLAAVEDALKAGITAVQLREKDLPVRELLELAYRTREVTARYEAMLFINERVDIAICVEADGVHLGQAGIPVQAARRIAGRRLFIGASTHNLEEALTAEREGADFITFGPVYDTPSKRTYGEPVGIGALQTVSEKVSLPVFGIGGISSARVKEVRNAGARGIALISGILGETNIKGAAEEYLRTMGDPHLSRGGQGEGR